MTGNLASIFQFWEEKRMITIVKTIAVNRRAIRNAILYTLFMPVLIAGSVNPISGMCLYLWVSHQSFGIPVLLTYDKIKPSARRHISVDVPVERVRVILHIIRPLKFQIQGFG